MGTKNIFVLRFIFGNNIFVTPAPPTVESKLKIFAAQQEINYS